MQIIIKEINFRIPEGISGVEVKLGALEALTKYFKKYFDIQTRLNIVIVLQDRPSHGGAPKIEMTFFLFFCVFSSLGNKFVIPDIASRTDSIFCFFVPFIICSLLKLDLVSQTSFLLLFYIFRRRPEAAPLRPGRQEGQVPRTNPGTFPNSHKK